MAIASEITSGMVKSDSRVDNDTRVTASFVSRSKRTENITVLAADGAEAEMTIDVKRSPRIPIR